jgi:hypothetical protein
MADGARSLTLDVYSSPKFIEATVAEPRALYPVGANVYYGSSQIGLTTATGTLLTAGQVFTSDVYLVAAGRATVEDTPSPVSASARSGSVTVIDARDFGVKADYFTDDTAALQAALDAAKLTAYGATLGLSGNDVPGTVVELPAGRIRVTGVTMGANTTLRGKGPSSSYLYLASATAYAITVPAGVVQCTVADLGIVQQTSSPTAGGGIAMVGGGAASILGDSRHVVRDVVIVGTWDGISGFGSNESRIVRVACYRNKRRGIDANGSTDSFVSDCTVAQCEGDYSFRINGANSRIWGCKAFGAGTTSSQLAHFNIAGAGRHQLAACESQDGYGQGFDIGGNDVSTLTSCTADSCRLDGFHIGAVAPARVIGCSVVTRTGGAYTPRSALDIQSGSGCTFDLQIKGSIPAFSNFSSSRHGNQITINQGGPHGEQSVTYAAAITPDPYNGSSVFVGQLTGDITINAPSGTWSSAGSNLYPYGQRLAFTLRQDATGGRNVTFNAIYKTSAAIPTTANSVTRVEFEFDGTNWREIARATT